MKLLKSALHLFTGKPQPRWREPGKMTRRDIIERESELASDIFGAIPNGGSRQFFCLDEHTWIWYEEWIDDSKQKRSQTTRYELHDNGILKVQEGLQYQFLDGEELRNFAIAVRMYYERAMRGVFGRDPVTGQPLTAMAGTISSDA